MTLIFTNNLNVPYSLVLYEGRILDLEANQSVEVEFTQDELLMFIDFNKPSIVTQDAATPTNIKDWVAGIDNLTINNIITISTKSITPYLTFESEDGSDFTFRTVVVSKGNFEYSADGNTWEPYTLRQTIDSTNGRILIRGSNNTTLFTKLNNRPAFTLKSDTSAKIKCIGNIETLLDWQTVIEGKHPPMDKFCFSGLFHSQPLLTTAPELPATELSDYCYTYMFYGCKNLKEPPKLPATKLSNNCYQHMFSRCTSLKKIPELPAIELTNSCYGNMFYGCTSLVETPDTLPATKLAKECYNNMFGSSNISKLPKLPATQLAEGCYINMFAHCNNIINTPADYLPAQQIENNCYAYMFLNCEKLKTAPSLPAKELKIGCYQSMFKQCYELSTIPQLNILNLADNCCNSMFVEDVSIRISRTQRTGETADMTFITPYVIKCSSANESTDALTNMFYAIGLTADQSGNYIIDTPDINVTYYISSANSVV